MTRARIVPPIRLAAAKLAFARALWKTGEHDKAEALAKQARAELANVTAPELAAEIDRWLTDPHSR